MTFKGLGAVLWPDVKVSEYRPVASEYYDSAFAQLPELAKVLLRLRPDFTLSMSLEYGLALIYGDEVIWR